MSIGQAAGAVVGAVAGFFLAGPLALAASTAAYYGAQYGMIIGGILDPPKGKTVQGPRLSDLTIQTSTYGSVIPRTYGSTTLFGNVFWLENNAIKEVAKKKKTGGKGGGAKTTTITYSVYATFALGLCDCPSRPIVGVRKITISGKPFYDAGSTDQSAIRSSNAASALFTVHTGSDTQLPDDRMQATLGINATPAYRGLAYIVFKDLPLAKYGDSLLAAQIKVEVISDGSIASYTSVISGDMSSGHVLNAWRAVAWNGRVFCAVGTNCCAVSPDGLTWTPVTPPANRQWSNIIWSGKLFLISSFDGYPNNNTAVSPDGINWTLSASLSATHWVVQSIAYGKGIFTALGGSHCSTSPDGLTWTLQPDHPAGSSNILRIVFNGKFFLACAEADTIISYDGSNWSLNSGVLPGGDLAIWTGLDWNGSIFLVTEFTGALSFTSPDGINWTSRTPPHYTINGQCWNGSVFALTSDSGSNKFWISPDGITWTGYTPVTPHYGYGIAWNGAVFCQVGNNVYYSIAITPSSLSVTLPTLDNIVKTEMLLSKILLTGDVNTTALTQPVRGCKIAAVAAIRSGIETLQGAWPFDVVQHGYTIQAKPRPSSSVVSIPETDLDARSSGDTPGITVTTVREMDTQLPRRVSISYLDIDREYDPNEQYDERLNTDAVNVLRIEMAISLSSGEAAQIAQRLLYMYWLERYNVTFSLPPTYNQLEPGDVVTLTTSTGTYLLRLTQITYTSDGRLECSAKYNSTAIYTAVALGATGSATPPTLGEVGPSIYALLDLPTLIDLTDNPGMSVAMTGYRSGWKGGAVYRSIDSGVSWSELTSIESPGATMAVADAPINTARFDIIDTRSVLVAHMIQGTLSSVSELSLLAGENYFAYGIPGRWEIIAAKNCTLQGSGDYWLADILRGQYGTEWAATLHQTNDFIILLDENQLSFVTYANSYIGKTHLYRGINEGAAIDSDYDYPITYLGTSLKPLSPVYLNTTRNPVTADHVLSWIKRTRIGGAWADVVDVPLSEASEAYEIEIYSSNTYTTLKRTLTAITPSVTYTTAMQVADFGFPQATVYAKVYQMSSIVGRGTPLIDSAKSYSSPGAFLAHMDTSGFPDVYGQNMVIATATCSATASKFGGFSAYATTGVILYDVAHGKFATGSDDFTFECWVRPDSFSANRVIFSCGSGSTYYEFNLGSTGKRPKFIALISGVTVAQYEATADVTMVAGTWYALAVERIGGNIVIFLDGVPVPTTVTVPVGTNIVGQSWYFVIFGASGSGNPNFQGYIEEFRMTRPGNQYNGQDYSATLQTSAFLE